MPYKDPAARREYQRRYYADRNIRHRNPNEIPRQDLAYVTKSIRFEEEDYQNLIRIMLAEHAGSSETFNFAGQARRILIEWAAERAVARRQARLAGPTPDPAGPAF